MAKLLVLFHSFYGTTFKMAEEVGRGASSTGSVVTVKQVPEVISSEALAASGATEAKKKFAHIPTATVDELAEYDGIAIGTGTRFGNMSSTMRSFWDQTGKLWANGALIGKAGTVFGSSGTGGGHETTIVSAWFTLAHHGMVIVPLGYRDPSLRQASEVHGCSPYGASAIQKGGGDRPSAKELGMAFSQGAAWALVAHQGSKQ